MQPKMLRTGVLNIVAVLLLAGCTTSNPVPVNRDGLRRVVGADLIGARGATGEDQMKIDLTISGLCGGGVYTRSECARHGRESKD